MRSAPHSSDIGVRPGLFVSGREAFRVLGIALLLASPLWVGVIAAAVMIWRAG